MMNAPELLPCPFCGLDDAKIVTIRDGRMVNCHNCHASGPAYYHGTQGIGATPALAAEKWNRRADLRSPLGAVVKPLVWDAPCDANNWTHIARSFFGDYYVAVDGGRHQAWLAANEKPYERDIGEVVGRLYEAQAAAQADYTARILAALKPPTHAALLAHAMKLPEVAALAEAMREIAQNGDDRAARIARDALVRMGGKV